MMHRHWPGNGSEVWWSDGIVDSDGLCEIYFDSTNVYNDVDADCLAFT